MGHRASYAIRQNGRVEVFYSHWGALTVPQDIFWGPAHAEGFIRSLEPSEEWLDDVWGEGGVALDKDKKRLAFYGGELAADLEELWLALMRQLWVGWSLRMVSGMPEVAETVGVDPDLVRAPPLPVEAADLDQLGSWSHGSFVYVCTRRGREFDDRAADVANVSSLFAHGPGLVHQAPRMPTLEQARTVNLERELASWEDEDDRRLGSACRGAILLEPAQRRVCVWMDPWRRRDAVTAAEAWRGWRVDLRDGGAAEMLEATGRTVTAEWLAPPEDDAPAPRSASEQLQAITDALLGTEARKAGVADFARRALHEVSSDAEGTSLMVAPGFLDDIPTSVPGDGATVELLLRYAMSALEAEAQPDRSDQVNRAGYAAWVHLVSQRRWATADDLLAAWLPRLAPRFLSTYDTLVADTLVRYLEAGRGVDISVRIRRSGHSATWTPWVQAIRALDSGGGPSDPDRLLAEVSLQRGVG